MIKKYWRKNSKKDYHQTPRRGWGKGLVNSENERANDRTDHVRQKEISREVQTGTWQSTRRI